MKQKKTSTKNKDLESKIAAAFESNLKSLSPEYRKIIANDLVCAFQNRLQVLEKAKPQLNILTACEEKIPLEAQRTRNW